jgi:WD40 repeat protein
MTRTEERLTDALRASAGRVQDGKLRPLPADPAHPEGRHKAWLVPAAAAASVVLVIGLVVTVTGGLRPARSPGPATASGQAVPPGRPPYVAAFPGLAGFSGPVDSPYVVVRSALTGAVTARVATPEAPAHLYLFDNLLAAAPDGRTFYVEFGTEPSTGSSQLPSTRGSQIRIYTFSITSSGSATPMTPVKGGTFVSQFTIAPGGSLAVSPDGSELALTAASNGRTSLGNLPDQILVINLRTGARSTWQGGLDRPGLIMSIADVSWAVGGRSLVFLAQWCSSSADVCVGIAGPPDFRDAQVRSLSVASGGGALDQGPVLLRSSARYPVIVQAFAGPDGGDLTALVMSGRVGTQTPPVRRLTVVRISAATGSVLGTDYRTGYHSSAGVSYSGGLPALAWISPDPSGRYLLFSYATGGDIYVGWLGQGQFHLLTPPRSPSGIPAW